MSNAAPRTRDPFADTPRKTVKSYEPTPAQIAANAELWREIHKNDPHADAILGTGYYDAGETVNGIQI